MSLGFALDATLRGLISTSSRIQLTSQNITNADRAGYTRKESAVSYITTNGGTTPVRTDVLSGVNRFLSQQTNTDISSMGYREAISEYMTLYGRQLGATDGANTLSSFLNDMYGALQQLATTPEIMANKSEVVMLGVRLSDNVRGLSSKIQDQRLQADRKIAETVTMINSTVQKIHDLNQQIQGIDINNVQLAEYEDQRMIELEKLAKEMDIQYFFTSNNQVQIYTGSGEALLLATPKPINYTSSTVVTGSVVYPAGFAPIDLNGTDLTTLLGNGRLGGLVQIRDVELVQEQEKLDEFSRVLMDQFNAAINRGTSLPPNETLTGTVQGLTLGTAFSATGNLDIRTISGNGTIQTAGTINLATTPTIGSLITALNGIAGINASLGPNGELIVDSTVANIGVALAHTGGTVAPLGRGFSHAFGLNDFFRGTGGESLNVTDTYRTNSQLLPTGALNIAAAVGELGVTRGDGSIATAVATSLVSNTAFGAAGNFGAQTNTITRYIEAFMADGANKARLAEGEFETAQLVFQQTKDILTNTTAVNVDEETARLLELQNAYQASARVISTIRELYASLLEAVR
jgi:flagellar hook-associated protein 1